MAMWTPTEVTVWPFSSSLPSPEQLDVQVDSGCLVFPTLIIGTTAMEMELRKRMGQGAGGAGEGGGGSRDDWDWGGAGCFFFKFIEE